MSTSNSEIYTVELDIDQADLITCLLLDQLIGINRTEEEVNRMYDSYAEFRQLVNSGSSPEGTRFLEEMETLRELVKDEKDYVAKIETIIALWNR